MKYYKNKDNEIYAYEEIVKDELIGQKVKELGLTPLTQKELDELNKPKEPSLDEIKADFLRQIDAILDNEARAHGYDDIKTAVSYAAMPNEFYEEGKAFFEWRSIVYKYCYGILEKVQRGELEITPENIERTIDEMPKLNLGVGNE